MGAHGHTIPPPTPPLPFVLPGSPTHSSPESVLLCSLQLPPNALALTPWKGSVRGGGVRTRQWWARGADEQGGKRGGRWVGELAEKAG